MNSNNKSLRRWAITCVVLLAAIETGIFAVRSDDDDAALAQPVYASDRAHGTIGVAKTMDDAIEIASTHSGITVKLPRYVPDGWTLIGIAALAKGEQPSQSVLATYGTSQGSPILYIQRSGSVVVTPDETVLRTPSLKGTITKIAIDQITSYQWHREHDYVGIQIAPRSLTDDEAIKMLASVPN